MKPLNEGRAGRLLVSLADAVLEHPWWFLCTQALLVLLCLGYTLTTLQFSTDRNDLISVQESYRQRFLEFKREFAIHDNLFVLVESESREKNRAFVERLATRLQLDGHFAGVYYRGGLKLMGPKALLFLPAETLTELRQVLRLNQPFFEALSNATNLDTLFGLVNQQFRLLATTPAARPEEGTLARALPTLQRVLETAADCLESSEIPLAPDLATLFAGGPGQMQQELYLTFDHGQMFVLIAQAKHPDQEQAAIKRLRKWIAQTRAEVAGVSVEITGEPVLRHDEMAQARRDTETAALISLVLTALILIGSCREVWRPLMATVCLLLGIGYTLGLATLTVGRLNILSLTLVPILIGLAIDYGVHLIFRYEEELRRGQSRRRAIGKALGRTGIGVVSSAFTIAGAFYFMMLTRFKGMQEMGWIAGSGILVCLAPMLTVLPLLLVRGPSDPPARRAKRGEPNGPTVPAPPASKHPWLVLVGGAVFTLFAVVQSFKLQFDYNLLNLQSRGLPAVRMQHKLTQAGSHSLLYGAVIADSLPQAREWEQRLNQLPSVARVISLVKYLTEDQEQKLALIKEIKQQLGAIALPQTVSQPVNLTNLNRALSSLRGYLARSLRTLQSGEGDASLAERLRSLRDAVRRLQRLTVNPSPATANRLTLFEQRLFDSLQEALALIAQQDDRQRLQRADVPTFLRDVFISRSGKFLLQVYPKEDVWQREQQATFIRELRTVDLNVTGAPVQFYEYTSRLKENVERAAAYAAGIIALVVFLHFRRLNAVLLALLPVGLGFCWTLGVMGWLGMSFNPVNIVSLILLIGIGVTNGVHILNRFAEEPQPNLLGKSTGKAVLVSALNTIAGFGSLTVARHQGIASLGAVMSLGTGMCMLASLALLPAVLTLLSRRGWRLTD